LPSDVSKPTLRITHHMARSGGTVICKCLGSLNNIILLSEIHPLAKYVLGEERKDRIWANPLNQAYAWFNLISGEDIIEIKNKNGISFIETIKLIYNRCLAKNRTLVIRDWSDLDFIGLPWIPRATYDLTLYNILKPYFNILHTFTVRHPLDQWLSLKGLTSSVVKQLTPEVFLKGYLKFAEKAIKIGFIRYEDFTRQTDFELKVLCKNLNIEFSEIYKERWKNYRTITGDHNPRGGITEITHLPRKRMQKDFYDKFISNPDYQDSVKLLGYEEA
jgi:hypothetical protein